MRSSVLETLTRTRLSRVICSAGLATIVFGAWTSTDLGGATTARTVDDLATVAAALVAAVLCAGARLRNEGRLRLFWSLLAAGCGAWALGESLWAAYDLVDGTVPVTSWADVAYLAALPPVVAALIVHPAVRGRTIGKTRAFIDSLILAASFFFAVWTLVLEPLRRSIDVTSLGGLVTIAYPLGDVVILFLVVLVIRGTTGRERLDLWCLLAGLTLITFSDASYTYLTQVRSFSSGSVIDTGWFAGYLAIGVGAFCARPRAAGEPRTLPSSSLTPAAIVTPFVAMLGALSLAAIRLGSGHTLDHVALTVAFVLVGLVLARQGLLLIDLLAPAGEEHTRLADRLVASIGEAVSEPQAEPATAGGP
jgi:hypothetical protein